MTRKGISKDETQKRGDSDPVKVEISAGGVVFKRTPKGVRIAFIMDPFGKWAFAKGHVMEGETIADAALRETSEEMGLRKLRSVIPLGKIDLWFRDRYRPETKGMLVHKYVHYFLMQTPTGAYGKPQKSEKIRRIIWVPVSKVLGTSSYEDMRPLLRKAIAYINEGALPREGRASAPRGSGRSGERPAPPKHVPKEDEAPGLDLQL